MTGVSAGLHCGSSGRTDASIINLSFCVYGRVFSKTTALVKLYTPGPILIVVGPGSVLPLTTDAACPIVRNGFSFVPGFASLPVLLFSYSVSAIKLGANTPITRTMKTILKFNLPLVFICISNSQD